MCRTGERRCLGGRWLSEFGPKEAGVTELRIIKTKMEIEGCNEMILPRETV